MFDPPSLPPAGWYPDPYRPGTRRWWDGRDWISVWDDGYDAAADDGRLPDIGSWLSDSFRLGLGRWRASALIGLVTLGLSGALFALTAHYLLADVVVTDDDVLGWSADRVPFGVAIGVVAGLLGVVGYLALILLMLRTVDGEQPAETTAGELRRGASALVGTVRVLPRALGWGLLLTALTAVLMIALLGLMITALPIGIIALIAVLPALFYVGVRLTFMGQSIVDRPGQPFTRSMDVSAGRFWPVLGRVLLIGLIGSLISTALSTVNSVATASFGTGFELDDSGAVTRFELADAFPTSPLSIIAGIIVATATAVLVSGVSSAALALLYRTVNPRD